MGRRRTASLAFFLSIPLAAFVAALLAVNLFVFKQKMELQLENLAIFLTGLLGAGFSIKGRSNFRWLKTLSHEIKHAFLVICTGGKITDLKVLSNSGHVQYKIPESSSHYQPFIILAPYAFPLLASSVFFASLFNHNPTHPAWIFGLGAALAIDYVTQFEDLHSNQTDFKQILGGFFLSGWFIATQYLLWFTFFLHWVLSERTGFVHLLYLCTFLVKKLSNIALDYLPQLM